MKILITGANGFIGRNLTATLRNIKELKDKSYPLTSDLNIYEYDIHTDPDLLQEYCKDCDYVINLAGVNRPENENEFMDGNFGFASVLLDTLKGKGNTCPIILSSSSQASVDNPYGRSKKAAEDLFFEYGASQNAEVYVYRFTNVFGKWCRPDYNSAVATFCHNIANDLPIHINDRNTVLNLIYIDDLVDELISALTGSVNIDDDGFCYVEPVHKVSLGEIADLLHDFKESRKSKMIPDMTHGSFTKKLYSTYLSYLPIDDFSYPLSMNTDERGSFTELIKTNSNGQISVNISKPGITKGNHWHHSKIEKFIVVSGEGLIQFRKIDADEIIEYHVSGNKPEVIDIPPGYTHNIINLGETDLITVMWANENFDQNKPDTFSLDV